MTKKSFATVLGATALFVLVSAGLASAHVTIDPGSAARGGSDVEVTFRVPDEEVSAATTQVEVTFPTDHPITGVLPEPTPGWTATVQNLTLPTPVKTDDGAVTEVVSKVTWSGGHLAPGEYQGFKVMLGKVPGDADRIVFKVVQTYSNGDIVRWIDVAQAGRPEPEHPAPVLTLTAAAPGATAPGSAPGATPSVAVSSAPAAAADGPGSVAVGTTEAGSDSTARTLGIAGIVVGAAGLVVGAIGMTRSAKRKEAADADALS